MTSTPSGGPAQSPATAHDPSLRQSAAAAYYGSPRDTTTQPYQPSTAGQRLPSWSTLNPESRTLPPLVNESAAPEQTANMRVDDSVAANTDLQNPADALEFLAHVAERNSESTQLPPMQTAVFGRPPSNTPHGGGERGGGVVPSPSGSQMIDYPPLARGQISLQMAQALLLR